MKPVLIVENSTNSLIRENSTGKKDYILGGTFTEFGVKNRNERIYTADKFLPALDELNERITNLHRTTNNDSFTIHNTRPNRLANIYK